jgi:hypothetical protein
MRFGVPPMQINWKEDKFIFKYDDLLDDHMKLTLTSPNISSKSWLPLPNAK